MLILIAIIFTPQVGRYIKLSNNLIAVVVIKRNYSIMSSVRSKAEISLKKSNKINL